MSANKMLRTIDFTSVMVAKYYKREFSNDLKNYFSIEGPRSYRDYSMVLYMDEHGVKGCMGCPARNIIEDKTSGVNIPVVDSKNCYIFAGLVMNMILASQAICTVCGREVVCDFHRATGWPLFSAGMAGPDYEAARMIAEAGLAPKPVEVNSFRAMLSVVTPYMMEEVRQFLDGQSPSNINNAAYARLRDAVRGKIQDILSVIREMESASFFLQQDYIKDVIMEGAER